MGEKYANIKEKSGQQDDMSYLTQGLVKLKTGSTLQNRNLLADTMREML